MSRQIKKDYKKRLITIERLPLNFIINSCLLNNLLTLQQKKKIIHYAFQTLSRKKQINRNSTNISLNNK